MCLADIRGICIEGWQDVSAMWGLLVGNGQYTSSSVCPVVLPPPMCSYCHRGTEMKLDPLLHSNFASSSRLYRCLITSQGKKRRNIRIIRLLNVILNYIMDCVILMRFNTALSEHPNMTPWHWHLHKKVSEQGNSSNMRASKETVGCHYKCNQSCYRRSTLMHCWYEQTSGDFFFLLLYSSATLAFSVTAFLQKVVKTAES